jgi:hypothetical protein
MTVVDLPSNYTRGGVIDGETEEEHAVRLARISKEVKADMKAGRYRHGQLREDVFANKHGPSRMLYGGSVSGRFTRRRPDYIIDSLPDVPGIQDLMKKEIQRMMDSPSYPERSLLRDTFGGKTIDYVIFDEAHMWKSIYESDSREIADDKDGPRKPYWTQPIPDPSETKPVSSPSDAKRAKLRAKRKKRK